MAIEALTLPLAGDKEFSLDVRKIGFFWNASEVPQFGGGVLDSAAESVPPVHATRCARLLPHWLSINSACVVHPILKDCLDLVRSPSGVVRAEFRIYMC